MSFRALALAASLAAAAILPAPAAVAEPQCPAGSFNPVDFTVAGDFRTHVSVYTASPTQTNVCLRLAQHVGFQVALHTDAGVQPPTVTRTDGTGACAQPVVDMTAPVPVHVSVGADAGTRTLCVEVGGDVTTLSFGLPGVSSLPSVEVWTAGSTLLDYYLYCLPQIGGYWHECAAEAHRVL